MKAFLLRKRYQQSTVATGRRLPRARTYAHCRLPTPTNVTPPVSRTIDSSIWAISQALTVKAAVVMHACLSGDAI
ncbi:hypothetical protein J6590_054798 [Homalodisca vitripennis]|nr:hypothetical protein J6590_054798 [Homalodisca vitripennis]